MKGISFNVTLSKEQIEEIANQTADKVKYTNSYKYSDEEWYKSEIDDLKRQIRNRDKMIVEREIHIDHWKKLCKIWKDKVNEYKEKYGEL